jgi:hypothetical protein
MTDGYTTTNVMLAAAIVYGSCDPASEREDVIRRIVLTDNGQAQITLDIASEDGKVYEDEWANGQLAIGDLAEFCRRYFSVTARLKQLRRDGLTEWVAPVQRSEQWWTEARTAVAQRQQEREDRERKTKKFETRDARHSRYAH